MTIQDKASQLADYIRSLPSFSIVTEIDGNYNHLGATIADAVLQANMRYETHVRPRISRIRREFPEAATMSGLKKTLKDRSASDILNWEGEDRARRFLEIVDLLFSEDVETEDDLRRWLKDDANLSKLAKIQGIGLKTIDYFKILTGIQTCAIDRRLLDFLKQAGLKVSGYDEAKSIINLTADIMDVKRAYFDHSIWKHIGGGNQPACN
ncbi:MAG: hypothetical protein GXP48_05390 [Acidobacteria bacterium]|nr:hypothetical protein [Acidobacteriota bacterium]